MQRNSQSLLDTHRRGVDVESRCIAIVAPTSLDFCGPSKQVEKRHRTRHAQHKDQEKCKARHADKPLDIARGNDNCKDKEGDAQNGHVEQ